MGGRGSGSGMASPSAGSIKEMYIHINPNFNADADSLDAKGYNNNCVKCALAFEANMRGGDTEAEPFKFGYSEEIDRSENVNRAFGVDRTDIWDVGRPTRSEAVREINLTMKEDYGNGSRAIIQIKSRGTRHTMNVINQNGRVQIIDAQSGKQGSVSEMLRGLPTSQILMFRTDNRSINPEYSKWAYRDRR